MTNQEFISAIAPDAVEDMVKTKVLASITIAQAYLESNKGKSAPGNNLFGVKGKGQTQSTYEEVNGQMVKIVAGFAVYDSWLDSIKGHSTFLTVNGRYAEAGFFDACKNLDFVGAARALQKAGYATDSSYADKLIAIITTNKLYEYDKEAFAQMNNLSKDEATFVISVLGFYWKAMAGDEDLQNYTHFIADRMREAYGIEKEVN